MSKEKHPRSRWIKGGVTPRYPEKGNGLEKYRAQPGWRNGARVYPR